ncbi:MAG TPA: hypothetical protein DEG17_12950 [Cyanobacteria bacterium UBA11149]|nr:hypothetical protein [Cyanobacteria bacterium UBA11367]HBE60938.1 hypothetical protein [Cyanobacteria bacterium UBA11366]HBK62440.1 hypothetical protein [Cyanobacteria bacterium UBA11166]HBR76400.1 hypothetical protein [Cyanobacteria bacterium UBA11159]HBS72055.1 hypothetical protein [Cyanobacteria bacterium UBA11153]HBW89750.1 hypothetical protein [Cyanobacteria bacterium UBA11149]HCA95468.1 hypothetical protein [Cyanobacteria bacterium UBA9226]
MAQQRHPGTSNSVSQILSRSSYIWLPLSIAILFAAPSITFMLPSPTSYLAEEYQPFQALEFWGTKGQAYHKYGPLGNFLLAPGYGISLAYWYLKGTFSTPSTTFPYGFEKPLEQISFLIFQSRVIFLIASVALLGYFVRNLRLITQHKVAIFFAFLFCIATNYPAISILPSTRPDSLMLAFGAAALGVYLQIVYLGLTPLRGLWLSLFAVCAVTSKEMIGPMFILPYLAIGLVGWRATRDSAQERRQFLISVGATLVTAIVVYALLNVVYAPVIWWQRIYYWLFGEGIDSATWGGLESGAITLVDYIWIIGKTVLNNLGPGGIIVALLSVIALVLIQPNRWLLLSLPFISMVAIGLAPIGYARDRFYILAALSLVPMVTAGLAALYDRAGTLVRLRWLTVALAIPALINLVWGTFTWHALTINPDLMIEQHAKAHLSPGTSLYVLFPYATVPGRSRLDWLGYSRDTRPLQEIVDAPPATRAEWLYATTGQISFVENCRQFPARAQMLQRQAGFKIETWSGIEGLGYSKVEVLDLKTPSWFVFDWMPVVQGLRERNTVLVFHKIPSKIPTESK